MLLESHHKIKVLFTWQNNNLSIHVELNVLHSPNYNLKIKNIISNYSWQQQTKKDTLKSSKSLQKQNLFLRHLNISKWRGTQILTRQSFFKTAPIPGKKLPVQKTPLSSMRVNSVFKGIKYALAQGFSGTYILFECKDIAKLFF